MGTGIIKCHSGNEYHLVTKLRECAPSTGSDWRGSSRKQPRGLQLSLLAQQVNVAQPMMVAQPVGVGTVSLGGPAQWALGRHAVALSLCNECNECNEFADGTRYILVTLSSLVRAMFSWCNECNQFFSGFF